MQFGAVLKRMRKGAGMSQEQLAEKLHISRSNISRLETDIYELKAADLIRWAQVTNAQDMLVALICGVDITIVQQILESATMLVGAIIGGIL